MDPDQTVLMLLDALADEDWDQVEELSLALREWLDKGGFPPIIIGDPSLGDRWHRTVARLLCRLAANMLP